MIQQSFSLLLQGVPMEDVLRVLRQRFGTSGVEEKAARPPKPQQQ
jgi:phosphoribosyl-ATP pyrophosphohydrolase/phosphoribosyl-AMP cyclohydrolase